MVKTVLEKERERERGGGEQERREGTKELNDRMKEDMHTFHAVKGTELMKVKIGRGMCL